MFGFLFFEDAEGFAGEGGCLAAGKVSFLVQGVVHFLVVIEDVFQFLFGEVGGVEDIAELLAVEPVELGIYSIELGAEVGSTVLVPFEGWEGNAVISDLSPFGRVPGMTAGDFFVLLPLGFDGLAKLLICIAPDVVSEGFYIPC